MTTSETTDTRPRCPMAPPEFDPLSEAALRDPASMYTTAREKSPVFWSDLIQSWVFTRYDDVFRYLNEPELFGTPVEGQITVPDEFVDRFSPELPSKMMTAMDPPVHTPPKKAVQQGFLRPNILKLEPRITARANALIDEMIAAGTECDLMTSYSDPLTMHTLMGLLDLPMEEAEAIWNLGESSIRVLSSSQIPMDEPERSQVWRAYVEGQEHLYQIIDERTANPGDDIISIMAAQLDDEGRPALTRERIAQHIAEIAFAGHDTTAQLMTNMVIYLSEHRDQLALAVDNPKLWPNVVEETLRRRPSAPFAARRALRDVVVSGIQIRKGDNVWFALASASNDPAHYDNPVEFDVQRRRPMDHVAFGRGPHTCPGAPLGRSQAAIGVRTLFERLPDLRVADDYSLDFAPLVIIPKRNSLQVHWTSPRH
ncbi:putative cytochrome P450 hydroxylase [Rhodococcus wratislaviensis]|uniref:Putative cytochrome P450 hydroxylase n=1 Tax=Rhodococcus wratislaviensis TaxID=44752 RepID=A0A402CL54_RHOWR|nr:cytochrome P450 [Rhodococcus wratislaviensis]GCE44372.1 putative cytochrome P450 hydroxylase [Rhodococcus wratislaviensis]